MNINKNYFSLVATFASCILLAARVDAIEFNTDILDASDKKNIDFSKFSEAGYILPGLYQLQIVVNGQYVFPGTTPVYFFERQKGIKQNNETMQSNKLDHASTLTKNVLPQACLNQDVISKIGFTQEALDKITYWHNGTCAGFSALPGITFKTNMADGVLAINIPQAWLEYSDSTWLPPSRWDNGIPGVLFDYNISSTISKNYNSNDSQSIGYNGTAGINLQAWRFRADYQGSYNNSNDQSGSQSQFSWNRFYLYRAIPRLRSTLTLGENYISSDIFSSWQYTGASLASDDRMLPPQLRGYAPQISGIAETNARVIISQQGRVLYDSTVPAGPFTIQTLDSSVRGRVNVEVIEQGGQRKTFQVDTAYVPYLTRPGQVRYKLVSGRSRTDTHQLEGPIFASGEASWGISNSWSLYGGSVIAGDYNAFAIGLGRDMYSFGTISADVTQSISKLPVQGKLQGKSWRLSYSKRFDDANADVTFAGYRFSEKDYMTMEQYLNARYRDNFLFRDKELYTITVNKNFDDWKTSVGLQYSYQTYWEHTPSDYYTFNVNRYFDALGFRGLSVGLSASRTQYQNKNNNTVFLRLSVPLGTGYANYNGSVNDKRFTHTIGYNNSINGGLDSYSVNAGISYGDKAHTQSQFSGYYTHNTSMANISANMSYLEKGYTSFGLNLSGGATITTKGAALHAGGMNGGTRLMVDADGIAGVPIDGGRVKTNYWGIGVVTDISSYYRNTVSIDVNKLPNDIEATHSIVESVLTEGAIGYRKFGVLKGNRLFATLALKNNKYPPFGASVTNAKGIELGIVSDSGLVWLSGVGNGEKLTVSWAGRKQCEVDIPNKLQDGKQLLLPCQTIQ